MHGYSVSGAQMNPFMYPDAPGSPMVFPPDILELGGWRHHHRQEEMYNILQNLARLEHEIKEIYRVTHQTAGMTWDIRALLLRQQLGMVPQAPGPMVPGVPAQYPGLGAI